MPKKKGSLHVPEVESAPTHSSSSDEVLTSTTDISCIQTQETEIIPIKFDVITSGLPPKQPAGRLGRPVKLLSNLYPVHLVQHGNVYHYDVKIIDLKRCGTSDLSLLDPGTETLKYRCLSTKINRKVIEELREQDQNFTNSYIVFDGKNNLYSPNLLELKFPYKRKVVIRDNNATDQNENDDDSFLVNIKPVKKEDGSCAISFYPLHELFNGRTYNKQDIQEALMALDTVFRHAPALKFTPIGRSFFHPYIGTMHPLSPGVDIWFGYHQSLRLAQKNLTVNLDTSATTFFSNGPLLNYFAKWYGVPFGALSTLTRIDKKKVSKISNDLKHLKIEVTHQTFSRKYCIIEVTEEKASELFLDENSNSGVRERIVDFYERKYGIVLDYPHLPCIRVKPDKKKIYFPLELCVMAEGQHCKKELTPGGKAEMIKYTADPPKVKFDKIDDIREKLADYEGDEFIGKFEIEVEREPLDVDGRILPAPTLVYKNTNIQPKFGSWNLRDLQFYDAVEIESWILLSLTDSRKCSHRNLNDFVKTLRKVSNAAGIIMENPVDVKILHEDEVHMYEERLKKELNRMKEGNISLVVVVIPGKSKDPKKAKQESDTNKRLYRTVKRIAEVECGLITQCIDHNNVIRCNFSLASNLCLKINAKMGGVNHTLTPGEIPKIMTVPTLIMGADVSHASVTDNNKISVAALVGSLNLTMTRFAVTCKLQENENDKKKSVENILQLNTMVKNILESFFIHTRQKPRRIIFYRDGVSEGQFSMVREKEIKAIRSAWYDLEKDLPCMLTYVVCQKRHHVRFKPADTRNGDRNVQPGTVIDTVVVHPVHRDFFLNSQCGLKGTNRVCHYTILEDDNNFSADEFQRLTYYLCNIFVRCTKSISHPVPVRYAHLAAYHLRMLLPQHDTQEGATDEERKMENLMSKFSKSIQITEDLRQEMYFV